MNYLYLFIFSLFFLGCGERKVKTIESNKLEHPKDSIEANKNCSGKIAKSFFFDFEDFSSEGAEGEIVYRNDTLINKIFFSFATSQKYVEQVYLFDENDFVSFEEITNYLTLDKTSYSSSDTLHLTKIDFLENKNIDKDLFKRLIKTAESFNTCWEPSNDIKNF